VQVPENDDVQSMWAPDVHKVRPSSALAQLATMLSLVGIFSVGVYFSGWEPKAVSSPPSSPPGRVSVFEWADPSLNHLGRCPPLSSPRRIIYSPLPSSFPVPTPTTDSSRSSPELPHQSTPCVPSLPSPPLQPRSRKLTGPLQSQARTFAANEVDDE